jgi:DNA polymerase
VVNPDDEPAGQRLTSAGAGANVSPGLETPDTETPDESGFADKSYPAENAEPAVLREKADDSGRLEDSRKPEINDIAAARDDERAALPETEAETEAGTGKQTITAVTSPPAPLTLAEKKQRLAAVRERAEEGRVARALGTLRNRMVFAVGRADAEIVLVGEAPGAEEERQGEPFVGPAGQLLNRILNAMGLRREDVYISNICKFRPEMENQGSRNRQPSALEMAACMDFVREEIRIIQPKVIVALGATAAAGLLGIKTGVMSARGRFYEFEGIPAMVTLHPSYLLHREKDGPDIANAEKRKVWEDMLQVMERADLSISDKQRRFFLPR